MCHKLRIICMFLVQRLMDAAALAAAGAQVYGYQHSFMWWALLIVASYTVGFTLLVVVFLKYVSFLKR